MTRQLDHPTIRALVLLALTGCGDGLDIPPKGVPGPKYTGSYGTCDPDVINALPMTMEELDPGEEAEMLACDTGLLHSAEECWEWEGQPSTLFSLNDVGEGNHVEELVCGYMWLDGRCCGHVVVRGDSDTTP